MNSLNLVSRRKSSEIRRKQEGTLSFLSFRGEKRKRERALGWEIDAV
jgi:hypothetical protein